MHIYIYAYIYYIINTLYLKPTTKSKAMSDSALLQFLLLLLLSFVIITGILYFIFYPAIVNYRKCRTNHGNIITLTTILTVQNPENDNSSVSKNSETLSLKKLEQELDTNFTVRDVVINSESSNVGNDTDVDVESPPILSIIIPAYDEEQRLPTMLHAAYSYLNQSSCPAIQDLISILGRSTNDHSINRTTKVKSYGIEWIVVNDGSRDQTSFAYESFIQKQMAASVHNSTNLRMQWKLVAFSKNCGKGAAVQAGMMMATGQFRLMVDADGATDFGPGLSLLIHRLKQEMTPPLSVSSVPSSQDSSTAAIQYPIIFGSRAHLHQSPSSISNDDSQQQQQQKRSVIRSFLMQAFHLCVLLLVGTGGDTNRSNKRQRPSIVDTQCGFKLFPAYTAERLFSILHLQRWAFDIELVYIIQSLLYYDCIEVVVPWKEIDGSKLNTSPYNLAIVAIGMLRDMICVRLCYTLGIWNIVHTTAVEPPRLSQPQQQQAVKKDR